MGVGLKHFIRNAIAIFLKVHWVLYQKVFFIFFYFFVFEAFLNLIMPRVPKCHLFFSQLSQLKVRSREAHPC